MIVGWKSTRLFWRPLPFALPDGPLKLSGNVEILSGTGRVLVRTQSARLCRCGASENKPFCDGSHARAGFRSED